jgi:nondiscriminating glutamyl-tRNA synthetase
MTDPIRVRFAPSPTGYLHIGNARTALFNYLFARQHGGHLILRIEDTDAARSSVTFQKAIVEDLTWLSIVWDEGYDAGGTYGPYCQSLRLQLYRQYAHQLLTEEKAYKCFCLPEDLEKMRQQFLAKSQMPRYDGRCRALSPDEIERQEREGRKATIRLKVKSRTIRFRDVIHGPMSFDASHIGDFVLMRSDGMPAYNFACTVDDATMAITHVIRGEDHLPNTPRQLLLYESLEFRPPHFAHHPLILGDDRTPLSKRHGVTSIRRYREEGYLPEALVNNLALLGWTPTAMTEIFSLKDLIRDFRLDKVSRSAPVFDPKRLEWINTQHIKRMDSETLGEKVAPFIHPKTPMDKERLRQITEVLRDNLQTLAQVREYLPIFTDQPIRMEPAAIDALQSPEAIKVLSEARSLIEDCHEITEEKAHDLLKTIQDRLGIRGRPLMMPIRAAVTGKTHGPELIKILTMIDRETMLRRLEQVLHGKKESPTD